MEYCQGDFWQVVPVKRLKRDKYEDESWLSNANAPIAKAFSRIIMIAGCSAALCLALYKSCAKEKGKKM